MPRVMEIQEPIIVTTNGDGDDPELSVVEPVVVETVDELPEPVSTAPTLGAMTNAFTFQVALYVVVGVVAFLLRTVNLDARPLAPAEAETAAAAWSFLNGLPVGTYTSPLVFTLDWLAFFLFGAFDLTARYLPAALSTLLVFVPLLARNALGRTGAFLAALMITFSPALVFFARSVSGIDLAVGAGMSALMLFYTYRQNGSTRALYGSAVFAALSLTADAAAFTLLMAGALYFAITFLTGRREADTRAPDTLPADGRTPSPLQNPLVRAAIFFAGTYILSATTFLLNRDGLGVAFNLFGEWLKPFATFENFASPLVWLLVYEPLSLIFGVAAVVLAFTMRDAGAGMLRLLSVAAVGSFLFYSLGGSRPVSSVVVIAFPLMLLAGTFLANLFERARHDIQVTGGWRSMRVGEIPVLAMLLLLAVLIYLQFVSFLQQTRFSPALDALYKLFNADAGDGSLVAAAITLTLISVLLLGIFIGLSILLVGAPRTTTLLAFTILLMLSLGTLRATWLLNFSGVEPVRELVAPSQTPLQLRDLVRDLEFFSRSRYSDAHVIQLAADPQLGAVGQWYLRAFPNVQWTTQPATVENADAVVTLTGAAPPGDWMGQRYQIGLQWAPDNLQGLDLWKWIAFREGGSEAWETTMLWLPTINE